MTLGITAVTSQKVLSDFWLTEYLPHIVVTDNGHTFTNYLHEVNMELSWFILHLIIQQHMVNINVDDTLNDGDGTSIVKGVPEDQGYLPLAIQIPYQGKTLPVIQFPYRRTTSQMKHFKPLHLLREN